MSDARERKRQAALKVAEQLGRAQVFILAVAGFLVIGNLATNPRPLALVVVLLVAGGLLIWPQVSKSKYRDIAAQVTPPSAGAATPATSDRAPVHERLAELDRLRETGAITEEEHEVQRRRMLDEL